MLDKAESSRRVLLRRKEVTIIVLHHQHKAMLKDILSRSVGTKNKWFHKHGIHRMQSLPHPVQYRLLPVWAPITAPRDDGIQHLIIKWRGNSNTTSHHEPFNGSFSEIFMILPENTDVSRTECSKMITVGPIQQDNVLAMNSAFSNSAIHSWPPGSGIW